VTITANYSDSTGSASGNIPVTVTNASVTSVTINPPSINVPAGFYQRVTLTGTLSDGTTADLTLDPNTTWQTSDPTTAQLVESTTQRFPQGLLVVLGESQGTAVISSSYTNFQGNTLSSTANVTVDSATLESIEIQGQSSIGLLESTTYIAVGYFSDGTSYVLNNLSNTLFSSSNPNVVSIESYSGVATGGTIDYESQSALITASYNDHKGNKATAVPISVTLVQSNQWSTEINSNFVASEYVIALDSSDNPILFYVDKNTSIAMASTYKDGNWYSLDNPAESSTSTVSSGAKASSLAIVVDHASGDIVYADYTTTSNSYANVKKLYLESVTPAWTLMEANINNGDSNAQIGSNTIALDSNYAPYIAFHEHRGDPKLAVLKWNGSSFNSYGKGSGTAGTHKYAVSNGSGANDLGLAIVKTSGINDVFLGYLRDANINVSHDPDGTWSGYSLSSNALYNSIAGFYTESIPYVTFEDTTSGGTYDAIELYNASTRNRIGLATFTGTPSLNAQNNITLSEQHTDKPVISYIDNNGDVQVVFYTNINNGGVASTLQNLGSAPVAAPAESDVYSNQKVAVGANIGWVAYQNESGQIILKKLNYPLN
jgi:hypothetical protein